MKLLKIGLLVGALIAPLLVSAVRAEPVTLDFWVAWDPTQADAKAAIGQIAEFEKAHPNIKIKTQTIAFDALHDKLTASVAAGQAPDLSWGLVEWLGELNRMNALADLTPYAAKWPERDKIYPNALQALTVDGKLLALPNYLGLRGLLYHEGQLKQAGVAEPPKTWAELIDAAQKIKQATGKFGFGIAGRGVRSPQELLMYLAQNDVEVAKRQSDGKYKNDWADNPDEMKHAMEVFAFYRQMFDKNVIAPQAAGWGWEEEDTNFSLGQYAMVIDGAWMSGRAEQNPEQMKDVRVVPPPAGLKSATFFEINPFFVYKSKHPEETWEFASFMLSHTFQSAVNPNRSPRMDVEGDEIWGKPFTSLTPIGVSFPPVALGSITRDMEESIGRVLLKNEEPASVAAWLGKAVNKSLRQTGEISTQDRRLFDARGLEGGEAFQAAGVSRWIGKQDAQPMAAVEHAVMAEPASGSRRPARRQEQMQRIAFLFLAPAAAFLLVLIAYPLCNVLWVSFRYANLVDPATTGFAGFDNYATILSDEEFAPALWHTFTWTAFSVAGEYALGLASAVALAQPIRGRAISRGIVVVPWVIPIAIAGLNWIWLLNPDYGLINAWMVRFGLIARPRDWLGGIDTALLAVTFVNVWRSFPFYTISLLAALQAVPRELHEAAAMDGAGPIRRFFVITMPHLKAVSLTLIFLHIIWTAINFDFIWVMTAGGPLNSSQTMPVMIYKYAMQDHDVGAACALASMSMGFMVTIFFAYYYGVRRKGAR